MWGMIVGDDCGQVKVATCAWPLMKKFHSSGAKCRWVSRIAPGSMMKSPMLRLYAMGETVGSAILTLPPGTVRGACFEKVIGAAFIRGRALAGHWTDSTAYSRDWPVHGVPGKIYSFS